MERLRVDLGKIYFATDVSALAGDTIFYNADTLFFAFIHVYLGIYDYRDSPEG